LPHICANDLVGEVKYQWQSCINDALSYFLKERYGREKILEIEEKDEQGFYDFLDNFTFYFSDYPLNKVDNCIKEDLNLYKYFEEDFGEYL